MVQRNAKKLRYRLAAGLLAVLTLLPACSEPVNENDTETENGEAAPEADTAETAAETEPPYLDSLPESYDMDGRTFRFYLADVSHIDLGKRSIVADEENLGDQVNDAVHRRNERLHERFGCEIELAYSAAQNMLMEDIRTIVSAGTADYDAAVGYQAYSIAAAAEGLFRNLADSNYLDFDQPWWAGELISNMSYGGKSYWCTGDITLKYLGGVSVTYVNRRTLGEYLPGEDLYAYVDEGTWTIDRMRMLTEGIYDDLNANGKADIEDQYGFMLTAEDPTDAMVVGAGISYTAYDENGVPKISLNEERMVSFYEKMLALFIKNADAFKCPGDDNKTYMTTWAKGNVLFGINKLYMTEYYFREMEDDYLILPLPKLDENQTEYRTATHDGVAIYGIPVTAAQTEETEMMLEAMAADSRKLVTPCYLDGALKNKYSRDPETARMIDLILSNTYSDFAMQYHRSIGMISHFYRTMLSVGLESISSQFRKFNRQWEAQLNSLIKDYENVKS